MLIFLRRMGFQARYMSRNSRKDAAEAEYYFFSCGFWAENIPVNILRL